MAVQVWTRTVPSAGVALLPQPVAVAVVTAEALHTGASAPAAGAGLILAALCWFAWTLVVALRASREAA